MATNVAQLHMIRGLATMVTPKIRVNSVSPGMFQIVRIFLSVYHERWKLGLIL